MKVDLPPVKVNTARTKSEDTPVSLVPGYKGFVPRGREQFGRTYGSITHQLSHGERRSLFKGTKQLAPPIRVDLPNEHPQAVLQKTSWTDPTDYKPEGTQALIPLYQENNRWETTNHKMMTKRDTNGSANESIRMVPGYQGNIWGYVESFGGTYGSIIAPLSARPSPSTKETLLVQRGRDLPMRESKGLQIHTPFTMPITPRDQTDIRRYIETARMRGTALPEPLAKVDPAMVEPDGSITPRAPGTYPTMRSARTPRTSTSPRRPEYDRTRLSTSHHPGKAEGGYDKKPTPPTIPSRPRSTPAQARGNVTVAPEGDPGRIFNRTRFVKPREGQVINSMFNSGRGGYLGQEAEFAASAYHIKNRPFGSQFKLYQPSKTMPNGERFEKL